MREKKMSMKERRIVSRGYQTKMGRVSNAAYRDYLLQCSAALKEECRKNPDSNVSMNLNHESQEVTFSYSLKDPELESLKRRMNKALEIVELDKIKRFFSLK